MFLLPVFVDSTGQYIYIETSFIPKDAKAVLQSPLLPGNNHFFCLLNFYYHMYGVDVGSLAVEIALEGEGMLDLSWVFGR